MKAEVIDLMGGQFPISDKVKDFSEKKKNDVVTPENAYTELGDWNDQVFPFMSTIWNSNLYNKFRQEQEAIKNGMLKDLNFIKQNNI